MRHDMGGTGVIGGVVRCCLLDGRRFDCGRPSTRPWRSATGRARLQAGSLRQGVRQGGQGVLPSRIASLVAQHL
jgi:hypothetical protein